MTMNTFMQAARLNRCLVTENADTVTLAFPNVTITLSKDFKAGEAEAVLFVAKGWMNTLRETLDNKTTKQQNKKTI